MKSNKNKLATDCKILIVDDDAGVLDVFKDNIIRMLDYKVETAVTIEDALIKITENEFDIIISDFLLEGSLDKRDALFLLKEVRKISNAPFIVISGSGLSKEKIMEGFSLGLTGYFDKPIPWDFFRDILRQMFELELSPTEHDLTINFHEIAISTCKKDNWSTQADRFKKNLDMYYCLKDQ